MNETKAPVFLFLFVFLITPNNLFTFLLFCDFDRKLFQFNVQSQTQTLSFKKMGNPQ